MRIQLFAFSPFKTLRRCLKA